jgi:hypothetical protein
MDHVPPALTPSMPGLFDAPTDPTPFDIKEYQRINGGLVWMLPVRYDIRKEVVHLCKANSAKDVMFFRQFAEELGYPQTHPSIIREDNQSAINLSIAPAISKKSRHIFIRHHFVRDLCKRGYIKPVHCGTHDMVADVLTKFHGPASFLYFRRKLFGKRPME